MQLEHLDEVVLDLQRLDATEDGREALSAVRMDITAA